ncbi:uncharacterized protein STEHIDRAFT_83172 [Stereum hirsutum FP-91666 SS1]|uniref:uncharacterized protein n=1 Tax=Stereum hirsutum (strain FP-91666) TaxID=721885 RepID=UPI00044498E3|nr:uncharacterized protein STEHIDRAFT_83172 [Stereum hirsutum FP-91666 SS1]EIM83193.1 hypothetical protein STEHIDRAFT_83172 [Stereum hirsutum FP-91666 SS1]
MYDNHVRRGHPILFAIIIIIAIIELGISASVLSTYNSHRIFHDSLYSRTSFTLFCSIYAIVFGALFLASSFFSAPGVVVSVAGYWAVWGVGWIFWLAAAASVTDVLGGGLECGFDGDDLCNTLNALEAFAWIEWILMTFALVIITILGVRAIRRGDGYRGRLVNNSTV